MPKKPAKSVKRPTPSKPVKASKPAKLAKAKLPGRKTPVADKKIAARARGTVGNLTAQRFAATGRTTRVQGHVSAHNKRTQGKRDSR